jgi:hypothetical protein
VTLPINESDVTNLPSDLAALAAADAAEAASRAAADAAINVALALRVLIAGHTATSLLGRAPNSIGDLADIVASADGQVMRRAAGVLGFGTIPQASVDNLASDLAGKQALAANLTALAALAATLGVIEQTAAGVFAIRLIGVANATDLLTRAGGDGRYQPLEATLTALAAIAGTAGLLEQTSADVFGIRLLGVGASTSVPTLADADARYQALAANLTALAALASTLGVLEQTAAGVFGIRLVGVANATDLLTRAGGDGRYPPQSRLINTTAPMTGGGDLSTDRTFAVPVMVGSGASHAAGLAPDPGATAGTGRFLNEDGTYRIPGGTSAGTSLFDPPTSPSAYDDEFKTSALAALWTQLTTPAAGFVVDYNLDGTFLHLDSPGGTVATTNHLLIRQNPALGAGTALTVVCRCFQSSYTGTGTTYTLLQVGDNATESGGNFVNVAIAESGGSYNIWVYDGVFRYQQDWGRGSGELWLLYQRTAGNVVRIYGSINGRTWRLLDNRSRTWNANYIFLDLQGHNAANSASSHYVDFVRVNDARFTQFVA